MALLKTLVQQLKVMFDKFYEQTDFRNSKPPKTDERLQALFTTGVAEVNADMLKTGETVKGADGVVRVGKGSMAGTPSDYTETGKACEDVMPVARTKDVDLATETTVDAPITSAIRPRTSSSARSSAQETFASAQGAQMHSKRVALSRTKSRLVKSINIAPETPPASPLLSSDQSVGAYELWNSLESDAQLALFKHQIRNAKNRKRLMLAWNEYVDEVKNSSARSKDNPPATPAGRGTPAKTPLVSANANMVDKITQTLGPVSKTSLGSVDVKQVIADRRRELRAAREKEEQEVEAAKEKALRSPTAVSVFSSPETEERAEMEVLNMQQIARALSLGAERNEQALSRDLERAKSLEQKREAEAAKEVKENKEIHAPKQAPRLTGEARLTRARLVKGVGIKKNNLERARNQGTLQAEATKKKSLHVEEDNRERAQEPIGKEAKAKDANQTGSGTQSYEAKKLSRASAAALEQSSSISSEADRALAEVARYLAKEREEKGGKQTLIRSVTAPLKRKQEERVCLYPRNKAKRRKKSITQ